MSGLHRKQPPLWNATILGLGLLLSLPEAEKGQLKFNHCSRSRKWREDDVFEKAKSEEVVLRVTGPTPSDARCGCSVFGGCLAKAADDIVNLVQIKICKLAGNPSCVGQRRCVKAKAKARKVNAGACGMF